MKSLILVVILDNINHNYKVDVDDKGSVNMEHKELLEWEKILERINVRNSNMKIELIKMKSDLRLLSNDLRSLKSEYNKK